MRCAALFVVACVSLGCTDLEYAPAVAYLDAGASGGRYDLSAWIDAQDGNDIAPAFGRAMADCRASNPSSPRGCTFVIPYGVWELSQTVTLCRAHSIEGSGSGVGIDSARSLLNVDDDVTAFVVGSIAECAAAGYGQRGQGSVISDVGISSPVGVESAYHYGILLHDRAIVERVVIWGFTHGVWVNGADGAACAFGCSGTQNTNANGFALRDVRIGRSEHAGVLINSANSNAGVTDNLDLVLNCNGADRLVSALGACAGMVDRSFLGNTHVGPQSASTRDAVSSVAYPAYIAPNSTTASVFVGAYSEADQAESQIGTSAIAIGGLSYWDDDTTTSGLRFRGYTINRLVIENNQYPNNTTRISFGTNTGAGVFVQMYSPFEENGRDLKLFADRRLRPGQPSADCNTCTSRTDTSDGGYACSNCYDLWHGAYMGSSSYPALRFSQSGHAWFTDPSVRIGNGLGAYDVCLDDPDLSCN